MVAAEKIGQNTAVLIIIGASLSIYPTANIVDFVPENCDKFLINQKEITLTGEKNVTFIKEKASIGFPILANTLIKKYTI
jgi:NAD-dependent deacetylase